MQRIPISGPSITQKEIDLVTQAVTDGWYENAVLYQQRFESAFAEYLGVPYIICLPSCTSAIHLALAALDIGPGDEVIVPDITWIASAAPVTYCGATPVFADIDERDWCLSVESFRECITPRTKAVVPVDLYGCMADYDGISALAAENGIAVIEDAAQAIGAEYKGRKAGVCGDVGVFSFFGAKTLTTGEGGMLVTGNRELYERVLILRDHGRCLGEKMFWHNEVAFKYKMSGIQAALGLAQIQRVDELLEIKRRIFDWYKKRLEGLNGITLNPCPEDVDHAYWMPTLILDASLQMDKEQFIALMSEKNVDCRPFFYPLSAMPAFEKCSDLSAACKRNRNAYRLSPLGVNLPSAMVMTEEQAETVCQCICEILDAKGRAT